ncbi:MAG: hypothetical protein HY321_15995 [Armatimonadetes bacterium]|nr:hypothetical protein [Armatimonadota bacterium]
MEAMHEGDLCIRVWRASVRRLLPLIWGINAFLLVTNLALAAGWRPPVNTIAHQLNMDNEICLAAWYASSLLLLVAGAAALQAGLSGQVRGSARRSRPGWWMVTGIALFLSADETATIHETIGNSYIKYVNATFLGAHVTWTELLAPFILGAALFLGIFLWRELRSTPRARAIFGVALGCWLGAVALETLAAVLGAMPVLGIFEPAVEETLENVGTTLMLTALLELGFRRSVKPLGQDRTAA